MHDDTEMMSGEKCPDIAAKRSVYLFDPVRCPASF
jgi:hypothetical protein